MLTRAIVFLVVLSGAGCRGELATDIVVVGDLRISVPADRWRPIANEAECSRNFEAVANNQPRQYQVLTVFFIQMTEDRKVGQAIAPGEYAEIFRSNPNEVTVLLRRDHGAYWLLSREMFRGIQLPGVDMNSMRPFGDDERDRVAQALRDEIDTTRHLLGELVAR